MSAHKSFLTVIPAKAGIQACILLAFLANTIGPFPSVQAQEFHLPVPGVMVHLSPEFNPPILKGIKVHTDNPFRFDFILDQGDSLPHEQLKAESTKLIKYFLASLTIPEQDLWVNLSPYEKNRIVPESFGQTEMGRDLLAEDYMLKQITASLIYPEDEIGKKFWKRIYEEAAKRFGTTNIPVNTFNKVWIVPEKAVVYENAKAGTAYVVESKLKVMLEQDYLALSKSNSIHSLPLVGRVREGGDVNTLGSQIVREIIIPELTKEVNQGKNFSQLRQVYSSLILATWYKKKIKDSILAQVYEDKKKVTGVEYSSSVIPKNTVILSAAKDLKIPLDSSPSAQNDTELIYQQYIKAFKKGAYNYIKEEVDPLTKETIPRKYFSGGVTFEFGKEANAAMTIVQNIDPALLAGNFKDITIDCAMADQSGDDPTHIFKNDRAQSVKNPVMSAMLRSRPQPILDPHVEQWGKELKDVLMNYQGSFSETAGSGKFKEILSAIESNVTDDDARQMVHNIWQYPSREAISYTAMVDYQPTAQHVLMAMALYIIGRSKYEPLTQQEAAYLDDLTQAYNQQSYVRINLNTVTLFALALCPYFKDREAFQRISAGFLRTFDHFADTDQLKVTAVATYLFLNAIHHTAKTTDNNVDFINDVQYIHFLMKQIKSGRLNPKLTEMAKVAVTRDFMFFIPWLTGKLNKTHIQLMSKLRKPLISLLDDYKKPVSSWLDEFYPKGQAFQDTAWAGLSILLYTGGLWQSRFEPRLVKALGRDHLPSLDILFLQLSHPQSLAHEPNIDLKILQVGDLNRYAAKDIVEWTRQGLKSGEWADAAQLGVEDRAMTYIANSQNKNLVEVLNTWGEPYKTIEKEFRESDPVSKDPTYARQIKAMTNDMLGSELMKFFDSYPVEDSYKPSVSSGHKILIQFLDILSDRRNFVHLLTVRKNSWINSLMSEEMVQYDIVLAEILKRWGRAGVAATIQKENIEESRAQTLAEEFDFGLKDHERSISVGREMLEPEERTMRHDVDLKNVKVYSFGNLYMACFKDRDFGSTYLMFLNKKNKMVGYGILNFNPRINQSQVRLLFSIFEEYRSQGYGGNFLDLMIYAIKNKVLGDQYSPREVIFPKIHPLMLLVNLDPDQSKTQSLLLKHGFKIRGDPKNIANHDFVLKLGDSAQLSVDQAMSHDAPHIAKSKEIILKVGQFLPHDSVVILGIGRSKEIPLIELCEMFDKVKVVDIDQNYKEDIERILGDRKDVQGRYLMDKVDFYVADVTFGQIRRWSINSLKIVEGSVSLEDAIKGLNDSVAHLSLSLDDKIVKTLKSSYVVSSVMSSQLAVGYINTVYLALKKKYSNAPANMKLALELMSKVHQQHMDLLAKLQKPKGGVYYSVDVWTTPLAAVSDSEKIQIIAYLKAHHWFDDVLIPDLKDKSPVDIFDALLSIFGKNVLSVAQEINLVNLILRSGVVKTRQQVPDNYRDFGNRFRISVPISSWYWIESPKRFADGRDGAYKVEAYFLKSDSAQLAEDRAMADQSSKYLPTTSSINQINVKEREMMEILKAAGMMLGQRSGKRLLELGSGRGIFSMEAASQFGLNVTGIENNVEELQQALELKTTSVSLGKVSEEQVVFHKGNFLDPEFSFRGYDFIYMFCMLGKEDMVRFVDKVFDAWNKGASFHLILYYAPYSEQLLQMLSSNKKVKSERPTALIDIFSFDRTQDQAMINKGGIDLTPSNMNVEVRNGSPTKTFGGIKFHFDPAMLEQLQNAPGFVPVIINIQPMADLRMFLGLTEQSAAKA